MILTCPSCETRFHVEPDALLPNGRTVRCGKCAHTWKEMPPDDIPKRVEAVEPPEPTVPEPGDVGIPGIEGVGSEAPGGDGLDVQAGEYQPPEYQTPEYQTSEYQTSEYQAPEYQPPPHHGGGHGSAIGWTAVVALVAIVVGGGFIARGTIIDMWPPASMLYEKIGLAPEPGFGLELHTQASVQRREGDAEILVITGEIVNVSSRPRLVPMLRGSLLDAGRNDIHSWTFSTALGELAPGETRSFDARVPNPPEGVRSVRIAFTGGGEG